MSLQIRQAKATYRGDPGLFGSIGRAVSGLARTAVQAFVPAPIRRGAEIVRNVVAPSMPGVGRTPTPPVTRVGTTGRLPTVTMMNNMAPVGVTQAGRPEFGGRIDNTPPTGYHLNKSGYYVAVQPGNPAAGGRWVPPGTDWVKNRRRNPANASATSNAIRQIERAKRYASTLSRITIRAKSCCK